MIFLAPDVMAESEIALLRDNGICVVVCKDPSQVKFVDPIPGASNRDKIETAAIRLSKILLNRQWGDYTTDGVIGINEFCRIYVDCLTKGTELDKTPSTQQQIEDARKKAVVNEAYEFALSEARASRARKKAEKAALLLNKKP